MRNDLFSNPLSKRFESIVENMAKLQKEQSNFIDEIYKEISSSEFLALFNNLLNIVHPRDKKEVNDIFEHYSNGAFDFNDAIVLRAIYNIYYNELLRIEDK